MFVHSLGYAAFLIDPITWAVLAIAGVALVRTPRPTRLTGATGARLPPPPRHHRLRLHSGERRLEGARGPAAADLYAVPEHRRLRAGGVALLDGRRGQHRRAARPDRGAAALLLPAGRARRQGHRDRLRSAVLDDHRRGARRAAVRLADRRSDQRRPARPGPRPDRDRRPLGADALRVHGHAVPARRARQGLLRVHDRQRPAGDPAHGAARRRPRTRARRACSSAPTSPACRSCSG